MTDRASPSSDRGRLSAEGLLAASHLLDRLYATGAVTTNGYDMLRAALRDTGPRPDSGDIDVERLAEAMRPLFDGPESVHLERLGWWEGDLLALTRKNIATRVARRYALDRASTPRTETKR